MTGCILPADKKKFADKVDLILNIIDLPHWPEIIKNHYGLLIIPLRGIPLHQIGKMVTENWGTDYGLRNQLSQRYNYLSVAPTYTSKFTAFVPIMTGCDNFCAYCAVPLTRGREVSRAPEEILAEVNKLIAQGYKEIILLGQNVNSYQAVINDNEAMKQWNNNKNQKSKILNPQSKIFNLKSKIISFPHLLKLIDAIPGRYWLSFLTSHPKDMSEELIRCFKTCQHLIPYLHLPLQSGSDKILKAMNRKYAAADYLQLIQKIHQAKRDICISTDIIVGFPGETKKDFLETADLMKKIKFDMAYLAEYSPRPGTVAARLKDNVSHKEKNRRRQILNEILKTTALANNQKLICRTVEVLVDSVKNGSFFGRTKNLKNVKIKLDTKNTKSAKTQKTLIGQFVTVKITKATAWHLEGKYFSQPSVMASVS